MRSHLQFLLLFPLSCATSAIPTSTINLHHDAQSNVLKRSNSDQPAQSASFQNTIASATVTSTIYPLPVPTQTMDQDDNQGASPISGNTETFQNQTKSDAEDRELDDLHLISNAVRFQKKKDTALLLAQLVAQILADITYLPVKLQLKEEETKRIVYCTGHLRKLHRSLSIVWNKGKFFQIGFFKGVNRVRWFLMDTEAQIGEIHDTIKALRNEEWDTTVLKSHLKMALERADELKTYHSPSKSEKKCENDDIYKTFKCYGWRVFPLGLNEKQRKRWVDRYGYVDM